MTLGDWLQIVGIATGFIGLFIYIGRLLQRLEAEEKRGDKLELDMQTLSKDFLESRNQVGDVRSEVDEMKGSFKELDVLKSLPAQIGHVSAQVDKIAGAMEKMNNEVQSLQTLSQLKNQMLELLKDASKDHEDRLRRAEAQIRDQR